MSRWSLHEAHVAYLNIECNFADFPSPAECPAFCNPTILCRPSMRPQRDSTGIRGAGEVVKEGSITASASMPRREVVITASHPLQNDLHA